MSDGIELCSPCCLYSMCRNKEYDNYEYVSRFGGSARLPVYTLSNAGKNGLLKELFQITIN